MTDEGKEGLQWGVSAADPLVVHTVEPGVHVATAIVEAVSRTDIDLPEHWSLNDYMDPEALDRLFEPTLSGQERALGTVVADIEAVTVVVEFDTSTTVCVYDL